MKANLPPPQEGPAIRMEDVALGSMQDLTTTVAQHINWTVNPQQFWVIAGLQGSGKSDFMMTTAGLMAPQQGRYWLFGQEMPLFEESRLKERLRLGLVFDGGQLFNHLTVSENIALPLRYHHNLTAAEAVPHIQPLLAAMELGSWADTTPGGIGRNWQKRVGLARALMLRPELLLVDNPLGGLDPLHAAWWLSTLTQLAQGHPLLDGQPITMVVTTADLRPWKGLATQFAVLRDGQFAVIGQLEQLEAASKDLVKDLLITQ